MFCPNCGNNLPDNAAFCGACGKALGTAQPQQQVYQQYYQQPYAAPLAPAKKTGALVMIAVLLIFTILPAILWFCDSVGVKAFGESETASWSDIWTEGEDETITGVFKWVGFAFFAVNAIIAGAVILTGKYNVKRTRFIFSRFAAIINLVAHIFLYIAFREELAFLEDYAFMTFGGVMFIISCVVLFILPFFISHATKQKAPAVQPQQF